MSLHPTLVNINKNAAKTVIKTYKQALSDSILILCSSERLHSSAYANNDT